MRVRLPIPGCTSTVAMVRNNASLLIRCLPFSSKASLRTFPSTSITHSQARANIDFMPRNTDSSFVARKSMVPTAVRWIEYLDFIARRHTIRPLLGITWNMTRPQGEQYNTTHTQERSWLVSFRHLPSDRSMCVLLETSLLLVSVQNDSIVRQEAVEARASSFSSPTIARMLIA